MTAITRPKQSHQLPRARVGSSYQEFEKSEGSRNLDSKVWNYLIFGMTAFLRELESRMINNRHNAVHSRLKRTQVDAQLRK